MDAPKPVAFTDFGSESTVLAFALRDEVGLMQAMEIVDEVLFEEPKHKSVWQAICVYSERYQGVLDVDGLELLLTENKVEEEKKVAFHSLFAQLQDKEVVKPQFLMAVDVLHRLKRKRDLWDVAKRISSQLTDPSIDVEKMTADVTSKVMNLGAINAVVFREASLRETFSQRVEEYRDREANPQKYIGLPFGIEALDVLTGGAFAQELILFFGRTGVGKTRTLASIAHNIFSIGRNVLYVTVEMPMAQIGRLFDSRHFFISSSGLRHGKLTAEDKLKYFVPSAHMTQQPGDFYVIDAPQGCSYTSLLPIIRRYKMRRHLDAIVVDYLDLMHPVDKSESNESLRLGMIARELKTLARLEDVPVITASQAGRSVMEVKHIEDVGTEHVSWSDKIARECDIMVFLRQGEPTDKLEKKLDGMVVKYRDGSNMKISLTADWDKSFVGDEKAYLKMIGSFAPSLQ